MPTGDYQVRPSVDAADALFGIYVHWPYCASKCPYCDFNSHVRDAFDEAAWVAAIRRELAYFAYETQNNRVTSIFFGGGTPSLMSGKAAGAVIDAVAELWSVDPIVEVTVEANPGSAEAGRFADFAAAGVNRVSIGVQSFDDDTLAFLGRRHSAAEARAAVEMAARRFPRFSFDMIYALPGQSPASWRAALSDALAVGAGHLSLYQLTIEPGTGFARAVARGELSPLDDDAGAALFDLTAVMTSEAGLPAYETSNHARAGQECCHNLTYWRHAPYVGVGPGAHGRLPHGDRGRRATENIRAPEAWQKAVAANGHGMRACDPLEPRMLAEERLMMGLRLTEGVDLAAIEAGVDSPLIPPSRLDAMVGSGDLHCDGTHVRATAQGARRLNAVLGYLLS